MPYGDRTGPDGVGAMTGRRLGVCGGYGNPGYLNGGFQRGFGGGRGYGRNQGMRFSQRRGYAQTYYQPPVLTKEEEKSVLEGEISRLNGVIESLRKRMDDL